MLFSTNHLVYAPLGVPTGCGLLSNPSYIYAVVRSHIWLVQQPSLMPDDEGSEVLLHLAPRDLALSH